MRLRGYLKLNLFFVTVLVLLFVGCSLKRTAVNVIGNALSGEASVYAFDDDPDLIREALPFALKTFEGLLAVSPDHRALLLAAASGFTGYAYLLQNDADGLDAADLPRARDLRARAHKLYLRGRDYALRGIELDHNGFTTRLKSDKAAALTIGVGSVTKVR